MSEPLELFLVENDEDVAYIIRACLERAGHRVTVCRTSADALIVLGHRQFHLVLLDYLLDEMTGLDLLRALHGEGISTPVLMITGYGNEQLATVLALLHPRLALFEHPAQQPANRVQRLI